MMQFLYVCSKKPNPSIKRDALKRTPYVKRWAAMRTVIAIAILSLLTTGCFQPGGGGSAHHPPPQIISGEPTTLKLTFSAWGAGSGNLSKRYTQIRCHYRQSGESQFQTVAAKVISSDDKQMEVQFVIPPQVLFGESSTLEYYFDFLFDGHPNTRGHETVQIIKAAA